MEDKKNALKTLLTQKSFKYSDEPIFKLTSGLKSSYYIDCKMTTLYSKGARLIGEILFDIIKPLGITGIGGLTLGADPIAVATSVVAGQNNVDLISFVIRKEAKAHGTKKWVEGGIAPGEKVVVIDDVITTGGSTIKAIDRAVESGLDIVKTIVLVDREEGGRENVISHGYDVESIFTKTELLDEFKRIS